MRGDHQRFCRGTWYGMLLLSESIRKSGSRRLTGKLQARGRC